MENPQNFRQIMREYGKFIAKKPNENIPILSPEQPFLPDSLYEILDRERAKYDKTKKPNPHNELPIEVLRVLHAFQEETDSLPVSQPEVVFRADVRGRDFEKSIETILGWHPQ